MPLLQEYIHRLEEGSGLRYWRIGLIVLASLLLTLRRDIHVYHNMSNQEAMDAAQLGRNLAEGRGYTTLFIRPFSIYLVSKHNRAGPGTPNPEQARAAAQLKDMRHPDLANPPVYPVVLAGLMKVLPFHYPIPARPKGFWGLGGRFWRDQPDFLITLFNEFLFFALLTLVFLLARRLFDPVVARLSAVLLMGNELFWRFCVSGLSTMLLMVIFLGLVWCLVAIEQEARAPKRGPACLLILACLTGLVLGVGALTRYAFGWLVVPAALFVLLFTGARRLWLALLVVLVFGAVLAPWVARNLKVSGAPFGTAGYVLLEQSVFQEYRLERSLEPDLTTPSMNAIWRKFLGNARQILQSDLPKLGGTWTTAFFLVGLMVAFRSPALRRLRYFLLACVVVLTVAQALGRTQLSEDSPEINSENLLVIVAPVVSVYGVSLFFLLLDQVQLSYRPLRYLVIGLFSICICLPLLFVNLLPRTIPVAYPPYYPPAIQTVSNWMKPNELIMSDIPWAVAWYGHRQCVWLTLRATADQEDKTVRESFLAINDYLNPIKMLFLTPQTMDSRFLSQWLRAGEHSWGSFIIEVLVNNEIPRSFPLHKMPPGWKPEAIVLTDSERWSKSSP